MILSRYLIKDIFSHTASVSLIFLFIIVSSRSIQYLEQAARGELNPELVFWIILYRIPEFIELIVPFSFFLSIILVLGRLFSQSEMTVMEQIGLSASRIFTLLFSMGFFLAVFTSILSLWLTPLLSQEVNQMLSERSVEDNFNAIKPGNFQRFENGAIVFAKEKKGKSLYKVFIKYLHDQTLDSENFISAEKVSLEENAFNSIILEKGFIYSRSSEYLTKTSFDQLVFNLGEQKKKVEKGNFPVSESFKSAKFQWSLSIPLLCLISVLLAVPISYLKPRQGRYVKILPGILVFISYLGLLILFRGWIEQSYISSLPGLFSIHILFLFLSVLLIFRNIKYRGRI